MASVVFTNIGELVINDDDGDLGLVRDAALIVDSGRVVWVGSASDAPEADEQSDLGGRAVLPGFVDAYTRMIFAGERPDDFRKRVVGRPISTDAVDATVRATRAATDVELEQTFVGLLGECRRQGSTAVAVSSGYGLTARDEARLLQVARAYTPHTVFSAAHWVPVERRHDPEDYLADLTGPMLAAAAPFARWSEVACFPGAFSFDQAHAILTASRAAGLAVRVQANHTGPGRGIELAADLGARAATHCTHLSDADVDLIVDTGLMPVLLPGIGFSSRTAYPPARQILDSGALVALATGCNPGTTYSTSMPFVIALAVSQLGMSPSEAVWAATRGGALALGLPDVGHLRVGAQADLIVLNSPSHVHLAYRPGVPLVSAVLKGGLAAG